MNHRETGQQCCYDKTGEYTTDNIPAGSADYRYPIDHYLLHQASDYFPYKACCIDSNDTTFCDRYYKLRPKGNSTCQPVVTITGKLYTDTIIVVCNSYFFTSVYYSLFTFDYVYCLTMFITLLNFKMNFF